MFWYQIPQHLQVFWSPLTGQSWWLAPGRPTQYWAGDINVRTQMVYIPYRNHVDTFITCPSTSDTDVFVFYTCDALPGQEWRFDLGGRTGLLRISHFLPLSCFISRFQVIVLLQGEFGGTVSFGEVKMHLKTSKLLSLSIKRVPLQPYIPKTPGFKAGVFCFHELLLFFPPHCSIIPVQVSLKGNTYALFVIVSTSPETVSTSLTDRTV